MNENTQIIPLKPSALGAMASRFSMDPKNLLDTLKNTVFKGATNEQLAALVVVANEHRLNPFTREIYAFPDKSGGIQAVVGVDGWIRIVTQNESFDGVEFNYSGDKDDLACTCTIHVKGRTHAVIVTEYLVECRRNTEPWKTYPRRMLRHKALIQAGRVAFGFGSLKDEDDVMIHPASATVSSRPIFAAEIPEKTDDVPMDFPPETPTKSGPERKVKTEQAQPVSVNYVKGMRGLLKLAGCEEAEFLDFMRATYGWDDSLSSLEEVATVLPQKLAACYDDWTSVMSKLNAAKKAGV
jgi:phage recombination protein Bet